MNKRISITLISTGFLLFLYSLMYYLILSHQHLVDFIPFFISSHALLNHFNPYPIQQFYSANLNPPFFLLIFQPLAAMGFHAALIFWTALSFTLGLIAAKIAFHYAFTKRFMQRNGWILYLLYFSFFPVLMDISLVQIGSILLFLIIIGYHFFLKERDYCAGIFWGIIIAIKFFPALLFFYVLKQKRHKVFFIMLTTVIVCCLLPLLCFGTQVYEQYFIMVSRILWYGDSWNASLYGFIFRQLMDTRNSALNLLPIETLFAILFSMSLIVYFLWLGPRETDPVNHQPFCLTIAVMLFLSPFGWLYYFPLLTLPFALIFAKAFNEKKNSVLFLSCLIASFFFINFPHAYVVSRKMVDPMLRLGLYSFPFYGLLLLILLLMSQQRLYGQNDIRIQEIISHENLRRFSFALIILLIFGLVIPFNSFLIRSFMAEDRYSITELIHKTNRT